MGLMSWAERTTAKSVSLLGKPYVNGRPVEPSPERRMRQLPGETRADAAARNRRNAAADLWQGTHATVTAELLAPSDPAVVDRPLHEKVVMAAFAGPISDIGRRRTGSPARRRAASLPACTKRGRRSKGSRTPMPTPTLKASLFVVPRPNKDGVVVAVVNPGQSPLRLSSGDAERGLSPQVLAPGVVSESDSRRPGNDLEQRVSPLLAGEVARVRLFSEDGLVPGNTVRVGIREVDARFVPLPGAGERIRFTLSRERVSPLAEALKHVPEEQS